MESPGDSDPVPVDSFPSASDLENRNLPIHMLPIRPDDAITIPRFEVKGQPFEISESVPTGTSGFLGADFDEKDLKIESASIRGGQLVWRLIGLREGYSQFTIYRYSGNNDGTLRRSVIISVEQTRFE